jgi:hypothetical protein
MIDFQRMQAYLDNEEIEYVLCAANWINDDKHYTHKPFNINTGLVFSGWRHSSIFEQSEFQFPYWLCGQLTIQGFLTNKNRFLNRADALKLVLENGQLMKPLIGSELTSKDLW